MFLGEFEHVIDDKGRVAIPARFREALGERFVLTRGFELCLQAFPLMMWEQLATKVDRLPLGSPQARNMRRILFAPAAEVELDRQGRIVIPQGLREYAGLAEEVLITGMNTYFEVWSRTQWQTLQTELQGSGSSIAEQMAELGI
ncbi:division/cell wall cluster transcriptional repressor MraZ [Candidatus Chloroploca asiatica]|uniref:Transcriptional regulator MraZ n=1 Tax=Candidatus Chloroploca asiatica TaxID=1506545 RepID=A0A2H3KZT8_9CHLR|nr:division/cell wall cluster transcriptional repressor MraZ [Candidatus Chloroploca asiatica]PDW01293.1 cell division/cell wall cluster transcriptional repressor MraZ [Candidatus Chloroploca asiatica]